MHARAAGAVHIGRHIVNKETLLRLQPEMRKKGRINGRFRLDQMPVRRNEEAVKVLAAGDAGKIAAERM